VAEDSGSLSRKLTEVWEFLGVAPKRGGGDYFWGDNKLEEVWSCEQKGEEWTNSGEKRKIRKFDLE
jgi:hypothetical protein